MEFLKAQLLIKELVVMQETCPICLSLGQKDLEEEMATHPGILPVESHIDRGTRLSSFLKKLIHYLFNMFRFTEKIEWN